MWKELLCLVAFAAILYAPSPGLAGTSQLGSAEDFAVLGAQTVTNTGSTTIYGDVGLYPGPSISGFAVPPANTLIEGTGSTGLIDGPGLVNGTIYIRGGVAELAQSDALAAYRILAGRSVTQDLTGQDLGGLTLSPGVYFFQTSALLTGTLKLDFAADPDGDFVFQIGSALTVPDGSAINHSVVNVVNGSALSGVYWLMGVTGGSGTGSATIGTSTVFAGNILALDSITLKTSADILCGRAIALNAAVSMDTNRISNNNSLEDFGSNRSDFGSQGFSGGTPGSPTTIPVPGALLLVGSGLGSLFAFGRRFFSVS